MESIQLKSGTKRQSFTNEYGKKIKLSVTFGDTDIYGAWMIKAKKLKSMGGDLTNPDEVMKIKPLTKELSDMLFGVKTWDKLLKFCDNNVLAILVILSKFSELITEGIEENVSK